MNQKNIAASLLSALLLFSYPIATHAKAPQNATPANKEAMQQKRMEKMKDQRMTGLKQRVGLSQEKADKVSKIIEGNEAARRDLRTKRKASVEALQGMLKADKPDATQVTQKFTELKGIDQEVERLKTQEIDMINKELTDIEQAKFYLMKNNKRGADMKGKKNKGGKKQGNAKHKAAI